MKLLVFAHTPPPHHGQSYMVKLMLDGFGGDHRRKGTAAGTHGEYGITCYHVNARLSQELGDIGDLRLGKLLLLLFYSLQAIWCRFRHGVENFYYVPAPGKHSALYRDWLVMFVCRRFFKRVILHWHAAGLAKWLETAVQMRTRSITFRALKEADLSVVLSNYNRADAEKLFPHQIKIVSNGIPDPCPDYDESVAPRRALRASLREVLVSGEKLSDEQLQRAGDPRVFNVVFLAHCMREKGLFDAVEGVLRANRQAADRGLPVSFCLRIAGDFVNPDEKAEFHRIVAQPEAAGCIQYLGFVSGESKDRFLRDADLFCFPTYYQNENQPVSLIEAMAFGLPIITTRWRSLPEMFPATYAGLVEIQSPWQIAEALIQLLHNHSGQDFRRMFLERFALDQHLRSLSRAFSSVTEESDTVGQSRPAESNA